MNRVTTVGELRAVLSGLPDDTVIKPSDTVRFKVDEPGLYVFRYAPGICSPAYIGVQVEQEGFEVASIGTCSYSIGS